MSTLSFLGPFRVSFEDSFFRLLCEERANVLRCRFVSHSPWNDEWRLCSAQWKMKTWNAYTQHNWEEKSERKCKQKQGLSAWWQLVSHLKAIFFRPARIRTWKNLSLVVLNFSSPSQVSSSMVCCWHGLWRSFGWSRFSFSLYEHISNMLIGSVCSQPQKGAS